MSPKKMNPIRRELLNGVFVLVLASLISAVFAAFQLHFDLQLWVLILIGIGIAVSGYVTFDIALRYMSSTEEREKEWLRRIGTPARLEMNIEGAPAGAYLTLEALSALSPGVDFTVFTYFDSQGGGALEVNREAYSIRNKTIGLISRAD